MSFAWPQLLWFLLLPPALLVWEHRRRGPSRGTSGGHPKILRAEIGTTELSLTRETAKVRRTATRPWLMAGLLLAIVALARPQWGRIEEPVFDQSREILLAVDLSRSMLAPDIKPSRLDRAKLLIQALLEKLKGERVGLIVFSGTAFLQSPLSADYEILREFLPSLNPSFLPEGGTNYRALIDTSLDAFGGTGAADRFLIILSDGEATENEWKSRVEELKEKGVRVIGLGVGTAGGSMVPDGSGGLVKDERGAVVLSKLESATLRELAEATGGAFRDASAWFDLAQVIDETVNAGKKGEFVDKRSVRLVERFQWPLALALWCLLVSFYYEFPVKPRARDIALASPSGKSDPVKPTDPPSGLTPTGAVPAIALFLLLSLIGSPRLAAAISIAPPPNQPAPANAKTTTPRQSGSTTTQAAAPSPLSRIVGRLSAAETRTGRDWAELAQETITWGSRLQSAQTAVPEGPVRDALQAVELGSKLDPRTADWPKLREQLEALLNKRDEKNEQQQQQQEQQEQQQQQNPEPQKKDEKNQDRKQQNEQKQEPSQQDQQGQPPPEDSKQNEQQKDSQQSPSEQQKQNESAFGDMKDQQQPQQPPPETQKVGGTQEREQKTPTDPALAVPLEKLDQLREKDSPAELFQRMNSEGSEGSRKKPAKDW